MSIISETITKKAQKIELLLLDVDGVLTSGLVSMDGSGNQIYVFNVYDGYGIKLWRRAGFQVGFITGRIAEAVLLRAKDLGVDHVVRGAADKLEIAGGIAKKLGITLNQVAFVGDDLQDLSLLKNVGFSVSVPNAREEVKKAVDHITELKGGEGAVREVIEFLLKTKGLWQEIIKQERILS